ncbi:MAG TPA: transketolase C-terminal domain-containing protein [Pirellulales bacterium]|jgi:transketolase|nr:transketolase C-terminal domain-containing protein [Pirellulales bacterium]
MRNAFADEITRMAAEDPRVVLLSGDIGNRLFDKYKELFPSRFFNVGVAEANMISVAAGLAANGLRPIAYTIASFTTYRCYEQIRVDLCYQNLPVTVVGVGAGMSYAANGGTHHSCEDIAVLRCLPNMKVVCPADALEARATMRAALKEAGPVYLRMGKKGEPKVYTEVPKLTIGKAITLREGSDVCLVATGNMVHEAGLAADEMARHGVSCRVVSFHTIKPLDEELLAEAFDQCSVVATVEEHSVIGGLGSAVAEWVCRQDKMRAKLLSFGTADEFLYESGDQKHARHKNGLTAHNICDVACRALPKRAVKRVA